jgi:hypothetical protein
MNLRTAIGKTFLIKGTSKIFALQYRRVVIGKRGAYIEFYKDDLACKLMHERGQEWRLNHELSFYNHLTPDLPTKNRIKVYFQKREVNYADYQIGLYYVSVDDLDWEGDLQAESFPNNALSVYRKD